MIQKLTLTHPIPSSIVSELKYEDGDWKYVYYINTPEEINDEDKEFVVYGYISNLDVRYDDLGDLSNNIHFNNLQDYMEILEAQYNADMNYRLQWYAKSNKHTINTVVLENRDYDEIELGDIIKYLAIPMYKTKTHTVFAAVY